MQTLLDSGEVNTTRRSLGKSTHLLYVFDVILPKICDAIPCMELKNHFLDI